MSFCFVPEPFAPPFDAHSGYDSQGPQPRSHDARFTECGRVYRRYVIVAHVTLSRHAIHAVRLRRLAVRIEDGFLQSVVFIGYPTSDPDKGGIDCIGTAFLLRYESFPYLITARHIAEHVG